LGLLEYARSWAGAYLLCRGLFLPYELKDNEFKEIMAPDFGREGLQRLKPLRLLTANLSPDPGSDIGRVCVLESAQYMRNQLLRDVDWAAMAHGVEVRVPLVDSLLLKSLAPSIPALMPGSGKAALAEAPSLPLPVEVANRAKTGFGVPTASWLNTTATQSRQRQVRTKGAESRCWSRVIFSNLAQEARL